MRISKTLIVTVTVIALVLAAPLAVAQVVQQEIRIGATGPGDILQLPGLAGPRQFKTGTGRIRGRVLATDGSGPIRRAQVRITSPDIAPKVALTDAQGRFEFRELPAGRFTLQATKSGYVSVQFGQTRPFESGKPLELADKQALDDADISMPRGSVISGRIVDEFGDPIPDVSVTAMRMSWLNGRRRLAPSAGRIAQTNDLGQYRIFGLPPGEYYVSASLRSGGGPLEAMAFVETEWTVSGAPSGPTASAPRSGYAPTYYPGTPNASEAQRITLQPGQEASSADFGLVAVRLARVSGIVIGSDGKPLDGATISVMPVTRDLAGILAASGARSTKDGSFTLNNVPPGEYVLSARSVQITTTTQGDNVMMFRAVSMAGGDSESGSTPLTVAGEDVANILLTTSRGGTATGTVTFDGPKPASITSIRVTSMPAEGEGAVLGGGGSGALKEDGSFELKGLTGTRLVRVANLPPGWTVKSVKLNAADITDTGAEFKAGETTAGLEVEVTSKSTVVNGAVTAGDGSLIKDYTVVIFSESPEHWRLPMTRWVTGTRPDQGGRFKVQNLPAGHYLAVAVDYVPQGEWGDPELLDRLRSKAKRFSLSDGATETLDLKLTKEY